MPSILFSDAGLRAIQPPAKGTADYWDTKFKGFGVRVSQGGTKTFVLNIHKARRSLGRYGIVTLAEARIEAKRIVAQKTLGQTRPRSITFSEAFDTFTVFNVEQIEGLQSQTAKEQPIVAQSDIQDAASLFIDRTQADIRIGGDRACYVPSHDFVAMPPEPAFKSREHFLATELHELSHWSGHKTRLDRDLKGRFGTQQYAAEELVAELSAAFLCAHLGIKGELRHAEYIATWLELLKSDNRTIFTAASKASAAADYLRSFSEAVEEEAA